MNPLLRASLAIVCGLLLIVLQRKVCLASLEPVLYWSLPLFHMFFHPLASGPSPRACLCALVLNSILVVGAVIWLLSAGATRHE